MRTKIKTIDVTAFEWLDKVNGNSYFAGYVIINFGLKAEKTFTMPFEYGYSDYYIQSAKELLQRENLISKEITSLWRYCDENKIILRTTKHKNCKKSQLKNI
jgi:hypothetical protein